MPNELKATHGPYTVAPVKWDVEMPFEICSESTRFWVAKIQDQGVDGQGKANAHLLAASWDLYHALAEIARPHKCTPQQFKAYAQDIASKAMAKARGEQ